MEPAATTLAVIRSARPADAPALRALQQGIYREGRWFVGTEAPPEPTLRLRIQGLDPRDSLYLVAVHEDRLIGWLELNRLRPERMRHVALLTIAVSDRWRRHGIGRALLRNSYDWCRRVGIRKITLNVRSRNAAAVALYEAEGFVLEGREADQFVVEDGFEDNLIMARSIG